jgi:hypothetical protein
MAASIIGTKLLQSTAYHPQTDGATERVNKSIGKILRASVQPDQLDWVDKLASVEYAINSSVSASTGFSPFELNYGYTPSAGGFLRAAVGANGVAEFADRARWFLLEAHDNIISSRIRQSHRANQSRRPDEVFEIGEQVYLSTENLKLPKSRARKLMPKFIGPYSITQLNARSSNVTLALPADLRKRRIHATFHMSRIRKCYQSDLEKFPLRDTHIFYDFGDNDELEYVVKYISAHRWEGRNNSCLMLYINFEDGTNEWQSWDKLDDLIALQDYLELRGCEKPTDLPIEVSR